jgi:hypothetical protein
MPISACYRQPTCLNSKKIYIGYKSGESWIGWPIWPIKISIGPISAQ